MKIYLQPLGPVQANCYVVIKNKHALVIDPGDNFLNLPKILEKEEAQLDAVLLTHGHFDHIAGLKYLLDTYDIPVYMNPYEFEFLTNAELNASVDFMRFIRFENIQPIPVKEGLNTIGNFHVEAMYCPGHSIGSTVYIIDNAMFSGDVLFQGSIGRCDLKTGSEYAMENTLKKLKSLTNNYEVYPGHGSPTTLEDEKKWNPYLYRY